MARGGSSITLRVFLASPGDVPDERAFVREFLESTLKKDPLLPGRVTFDVVSWDDPHANTTLPAHLTPQQAVIRYKGRPADCDIVVVILAARLGTHLSVGHLPSAGRQRLPVRHRMGIRGRVERHTAAGYPGVSAEGPVPTALR